MTITTFCGELITHSDNEDLAFLALNPSFAAQRAIVGRFDQRERDARSAARDHKPPPIREAEARAIAVLW